MKGNKMEPHQDRWHGYYGVPVLTSGKVVAILGKKCENGHRIETTQQRCRHGDQNSVSLT